MQKQRLREATTKAQKEGRPAPTPASVAAETAAAREAALRAARKLRDRDEAISAYSQLKKRKREEASDAK